MESQFLGRDIAHDHLTAFAVTARSCRRPCARNARGGTCPRPLPPDGRTHPGVTARTCRRPSPTWPGPLVTAVAVRRRRRRRLRLPGAGEVEGGNEAVIAELGVLRLARVVFSQSSALTSPLSTRRGFSISKPAGRRSTSRTRPPASFDFDLHDHDEALVLLDLRRPAGGALEVHLLAVERVVGALDGEALGDGRARSSATSR